MNNAILRKPCEWCKIFGVEVIDPDGWDRDNFEVSWNTPITKAEFRNRASNSTCTQPSNYILGLQDENERLRKNSLKIQAEINEFIKFLHSPKFMGVETDGSRKDWIATGDVINRLQEIRRELPMIDG